MSKRAVQATSCAWLVEEVKKRCPRLAARAALLFVLVASFFWFLRPWKEIGRAIENAGALAEMMVFLFLCIQTCLLAWKHGQDPASGPILKRVSSWGEPIAVSVEREFQAPRFKGHAGWVVTDQFLIQSTFFRFDVLRLSDLLWAYLEMALHLHGKYQAVLVCEGGTARIQASNTTTAAIVEFATRQAPWVFQGPSTRLKRQLESDEAAFVAAVAERRRDWQSAQAAAKARVSTLGG